MSGDIAETAGRSDADRGYPAEGASFVKKIAINILSLSLFLYPFVVGLMKAPPALVFRPTYLVLMLLLCVLVLPSGIFRRHSIGERILNAVLVLAAAASIWVAFVWLDFVLTFTLTWPQKFACGVLLLGAMEMTRRTPVNPLNYVAVIAILYALFGYLLPQMFGHAGLTVDRLLWSQIFTTDGVFGTPLAIGATYIGLFVFFAAFLDASGGSQRFMNLTMAIAGRYSGGPAKVAIFGSALMGMISGSAVTNIVTTGVITIPMMKRVGYKPEVAAAVESTASLGSQITPPILGATAFLMSEITGYPLIQIMGLTLIPCVLFYFCIFMQVHLASIRLNMKGLEPHEIPDLRKSAIDAIPFFAPIVVLVALLWRRYSPDYAISVSIIAFFVISALHPGIRPHLVKNFMTGIRQGAATCIPLVGSLAIAGVIIGVLTMTGLGDRLSYLIENVSGGDLNVMIVMTAVTCMLLGMGMVTVGAYVLVAVTTAPLLIDLGIPLIVAHLFIFYFAVMSAISPPVMVGVFAASSIAGSDPIKSAIHALRFSVVGFVVPFIFIYEPRLLMVEGFTLTGAYILFSTVIGIIGLAIAFERYSFYQRISYQKAAAFLAAAIAAMMPTTLVSTIGLVAFAALMANEYMRRPRLERRPA